MTPSPPDLERRFGGVARLYGHDGAARLRHARVAVIGVGGVGSWCAEALARTGIGRLTLIDLDMVAESNTNRQIQALEGHYGRAKVEVLQERIAAINPGCQVRTIEDFITPDNMAALLDGDLDLVVDAIDQARVKVALAAYTRQHDLPLVMAGAAGGKIDPAQTRTGDLAHTTQDPLLAKVRAQLRKFHRFPRDARRKFGITAVYSEEPLRPPVAGACDARPVSGLNCAGYGSSVCVTAVFGLFLASTVINRLAAPR